VAPGFVTDQISSAHTFLFLPEQVFLLFACSIKAINNSPGLLFSDWFKNIETGDSCMDQVTSGSGRVFIC